MVRGITPPVLADGVYDIGSIAKFGDIAYVPGTGPRGKSCNDCDFMVHSRGAAHYGRCKESARLRGLTLDDIGYVDRTTAACKYFWQRPEGKKPWEDLRASSNDVGTPEAVAADPETPQAPS